MYKPVKVTLGIVTMILIIVATDLVFFHDRFVGRLITNIAIVLIFATLYWKILK